MNKKQQVYIQGNIRLCFFIKIVARGRVYLSVDRVPLYIIIIIYNE